MRIVVFALCLGLSFFVKANGDPCDGLLTDECKGSTEVQPVSEKNAAVHNAETKEKHQQGATKESKIELTAGEFERLIKAIKGESQESTHKQPSKDAKCDDSSLTYAEFVSCKDLEAQAEMANGTTSISNFTKYAFYFISIPALLLLLGSFIAATVGALAAKRTANAAESAERAYVSIDFELEYIGNPGPEKQKSIEFKVNCFLTNYGRTPASLVKWQITNTMPPADKDKRRVDGTDKDRIGSGVFAAAGSDKRIKVLSLPKNGTYNLGQAKLLDDFHLRGRWSGKNVFGGEFWGDIDARLYLRGEDKFHQEWNAIVDSPGGTKMIGSNSTLLSNLEVMRMDMVERRENPKGEKYEPA